MSEEAPFRRLILVSNRLPFSLVEREGKIELTRSDGGLVSALQSYFSGDSGRFRFSERFWLGSADFPERRWQRFQQEGGSGEDFQILPLFIESRTYNKFYNGFSNATIWPLFHYFPGFAVYDEDTFRSYREVNELFAARIHALLEPGDVLWIHDYQLMLLPQLVREKNRNANIGFFLHIPFPSYEIFRMLHRHWKEAIIQGLLGADLIGFHTHEYVEHFLKSVRMVAGHSHHYRSIVFEDRVVKIDLFPLGIDFQKFYNSAREPAIRRLKEEIEQEFRDKKIIFSVDRLDYTKGITHRLLGFEKFLERFVEWREKVIFTIVIVPSREIISRYNERKREIEEIIGRINGQYSTLRWQPIIYRYSRLDFTELSAMYQVADIALITPLRDGMNLVAKEYVASRTQGTGVLILSELAGAANDLVEASSINPLDGTEMAVCIDQALQMPLEMQKEKMLAMQDRLRTYDVIHWVNYFLEQLSEVHSQKQGRRRKVLDDSTAVRMVREFRLAGNRAMFLDYDGTLVPFARLPQEARPTDALRELLQQLAALVNNQVIIISGRDARILSEWFGELPLTLVAEHGASIRLAGSDWEHLPDFDQTWKDNILPALQLFVERIPGSFIEEKSHTIAWHYRNVKADFGFTRSRELLDNLYQLIHNAQLQVIDGNKVIEVRMTGVDKGHAARRLVEHFRPEYILAIGDDKTDEDMFQAIGALAHTVKVGSGVTQAQFVVPSQEEVTRLLGKFVS
ncbi:MAG: bifunctional alpha,alpha-trehalose-phosphate synthase (UDP-forming)/trehalose-phosphatase [Spirochaetales bacterium]|nr:bifunctional alpha,alpha-trehalose-phosphate synthase (UDP-forming)/trehalose-phosphatase [Spirochaetales bacterium]